MITTIAYKKDKKIACMWVKINFKMILAIFIIALPSIISFFLLNPPFSEKDAMRMIFGNYDSIHKNSIWKDMKFVGYISSYFRKCKTGIVSKIIFQPYKENGIKKILLLTKTVPIGIPFECHACFPLLSATVFSVKKGHWQIESQNLFLTYGMGYGGYPIVKLVRIGPNKFGFFLEFEYIYDALSEREIELIVPYKNKVESSYQETIYYHNFNSCGWSTPCVAGTAEINFDQSKKSAFYELKVKRFGTTNDRTQQDKAVPVKEEASYHFVNGKYVQVSWIGLKRIKYDEPEDD